MEIEQQDNLTWRAVAVDHPDKVGLGTTPDLAVQQVIDLLMPMRKGEGITVELDWSGSPAGPRLNLPPITVAQLRQMVASIDPALDGATVAVVVEVTAGPFMGIGAGEGEV